MFFLDLVELMPELRFAICTGHPVLKGNDYGAVNRAMELSAKHPDRLSIFTDLTKPEYYSVLKHSTVQFNCGYQDWVSFTLLEGLSHGCLPVYPNRRDFSHVFVENPGHLYIPGNREDAAALITTMTNLDKQEAVAVRNKVERILTYHDGSLERIANHISST